MSLNILHLDSSARQEESVSRDLSRQTVRSLKLCFPGAIICTRDLAVGLPHLSSGWLRANSVPEAERNSVDKNMMHLSNTLVEEISQADVVVIGVALYNFAIPSTLKAWIDHICRARKTFAYTDTGPKGLLNDKTAIIAYATGGTEISSSIDFAAPYLNHILDFIGIEDRRNVAADKLFADRDIAMSKALSEIEEAVEHVVGRFSHLAAH